MFKTNFEDLQDGEELLYTVKGDTWKIPVMTISRQISGKFFFTDRRIAFRTWGVGKGNAAYDVDYKDVDTISTYNINFFIPTGIKITLKNGDLYKISVMKRKKYIELINKYK